MVEKLDKEDDFLIAMEACGGCGLRIPGRSLCGGLRNLSHVKIYSVIVKFLHQF